MTWTPPPSPLPWSVLPGPVSDASHSALHVNRPCHNRIRWTTIDSTALISPPLLPQPQPIWKPLPPPLPPSSLSQPESEVRVQPGRRRMEVSSKLRHFTSPKKIINSQQTTIFFGDLVWGEPQSCSTIWSAVLFPFLQTVETISRLLLPIAHLPMSKLLERVKWALVYCIL